MNHVDFLRGIEDEKQSGQDLVDGAEHLIRLKIQSGQPTEPQYSDLELEKQARIFGESVPNTIDHAAIPEKVREKHFTEYANTKAKEEPSGYLRGGGGGALIGGGLGALAGSMGPMGIGHGAAFGTAAGGLVGLLAAKRDKSRIADMQNVVKNKSYADSMAHHIADNADTQRSHDFMNEERRYHGLKRSMDKEADLSESVGSAALCNDCGKEKCACVSSKMKTAAVLKTVLRDKLAEPDWNKTMLAATTGLGALAGGVGTYLGSKTQKDSGKSKMEEELEGQVAANKTKPERGFLQKLKNRETESAHGISRVFREHPVKASLLGTLTGAAGGYGLGQLGGLIAARRGGK